MANKTKTRRSSNHMDSTEFYLILFGGFLILLFLIFFFIHKSNTSVKGTMDFKNPSAATKSAKICLPGRVVGFSAEKACDNGDKDGFSIARYVCGNGLVGVLDKGCMNPAQAFAYAKLACAKTSCPATSPGTTLTPKSSSKPSIRTFPPRTKTTENSSE